MAQEKFTVVEPPTSGEVERRAYDALMNESGVLGLVILAAGQEVPPPQPQDLSLKVRRTGHPDGGGMVIEGRDTQHRHVNIEIPTDPEEPATVYVTSV